jgi:oxygen-dependent protoporphyrinogen oxidase
MRVIIVGGGIAGLAAAWTLRQHGAAVTILEKNKDVGGRCRAFLWHGLYLNRGAGAFIGAEENLIEQAQQLGIYDTIPRIDVFEKYPRFRVLYKKREIVAVDDFDLYEALKTKMVPLTEKLALGRVLPQLFRQLASNDPRDPVSAAEYDEVAACAYFRQSSPEFVNYFLEPSLAAICGYGEEDFSLAWLLWMLSGKLTWKAKRWWMFQERGVGQLTHSLEEHFRDDPGTDLCLSTDVRQVRRYSDHIEVDVRRNNTAETLRADAVIIAVPGSLVNTLFPGLDEARRSFFAGVSYAGHHNGWYLLDREFPHLPESVMLPTADGFERLGGVGFFPDGKGRTVAYTQWKSKRCKETQEWSPEALSDDGWIDVVAAFPLVQEATVVDRYIERQDLGIARRPAGYLRSLKAFRALGSLPRVTFAGDYLVNSSVGQAHWSGIQAAKELVSNL